MKNIIKIITLAAVSAALAIIVEQLVAVASDIFWQKELVLEPFVNFTWFLAFSAVVEETSKYWAVYFVIRRNFNLQKLKFVLASLLLGTAWGIFEIGLIIFAEQKYLFEFRSGNPQVLFPFAAIVALHALTAFLMGVFISAGTFSGWLKHLKILFFPVFIHLLFNFLFIQKSNLTSFLVVFSLSLLFLIGASILAYNSKRLA